MSQPIRPWAADPVHWMTGSAASAFDRWAIDELGVPQSALMERAGAAAAQLVAHLHPRGAIGVLAGKGNNGGDALVVARTLAAWGRDVRLICSDRPAADPLLHGWSVETRSSEALDEAGLTEALRQAPIWVDGLLGTGLSGAARGQAARVIESLASYEGSTVSLDIPSGVDADTGAVPGVSVDADVTVAFGVPKLGSLLHPGRARSGRILVVEIGFPPLLTGRAGGILLTPAWARRRWPTREPVTHKNRVGALALVAGRPGMAGAGILAGRSALRAGAGYVRIITHPDNREVVQSALPEAVFVDAADGGAVADALSASRAVAVGPGLGTGDGARRLLDAVASAGLPTVLDADALTLLAEGEEIDTFAGETVLTPHPGEAARLLGVSTEEVQGVRPEAAVRLQDRTGAAAVVLKGAPTLVRTAEELWIDTVGSSDLAVAGMGDTLTGAVGSFLAQGCPAPLAAGLGLIATGRAAALADRGVGLQAADVPDFLPQVLAESDAEPLIPIPGVTLDLDRAR